VSECFRAGSGKAGTRDAARALRRILPRPALSLLLALSACAASLPLPPAPPAQPSAASLAPASPQNAPARPTSTAPAAPGQPQPEHARAEQPPAANAPLTDTAAVSGFSADTIARARRAMAEITKLNALFAAEMATTSDPKIQGAIYADFQKKYLEAVRAQGLSMSTYLQVVNAAAKNPSLSQELNAPGSSATTPAAATAPAAPATKK
jgi:Domain of unknown function (DUF4168)